MKVNFDDIPMAMEYEIADFDNRLKDIGWKISCIDMSSEDTVMLIKLKKL
jgi:hypothetical protein